jgi:raffinose/stachyose/melibiose transport system substrate-binding protein
VVDGSAKGGDVSSRKAIRNLAAALVLALVVTASALAASRSANAPAAETTTLNVWDYGASPKVSKAFNSIWRSFEKTHPGVTVKRRSFGGGTDFDTVFTTAMAAGKGPDIWTGTVSSPNTRVNIKRGLVLDLTPYYCKYKWDDKLARNQIGLSTVKGRFYGVPDGIESLVVFYNKDVFRQLGVSVPKTWAQLQRINAKAKAAGLTPISLGNIEKWPGTQWISALVAAGLGAKGEENLLFGKGKWTQAGVVGALQTWVDLSKSGTFPKASISMSFDEGISLFARKKAPMFLIGSFVLAGPTAEIFTKPNVGVFLLPSWNPKVPTQATESSGNGWIVNSKTKNPALAAEALNHLLFKPASQRILFEQVADVLAAKVPGLSSFKVSSQLKQIFALNNSRRPNNVGLSYLDELISVDLGAAIQDDTQALQLGKTTPKDVAKKWDKLWDEAKASGETLSRTGLPKC